MGDRLIRYTRKFALMVHWSTLHDPAEVVRHIWIASAAVELDHVQVVRAQSA